MHGKLEIKSGRLFNCSAHYETKHNVSVLVKSTGEIVTIDDAIILTSYKSVVLIYDVNNHTFYFMPRYAYSVTTWQHVRKFFKLLRAWYPGADGLRTWFAKPYTDSKPYVLCDGFYYDFEMCKLMCRW